MLIEESFQSIVSEPEIYYRKMMMVPPALESFHSGRIQADSPIYPSHAPMKPSMKSDVHQVVGDLPTHQCLSSSGDFVSASYRSTKADQQSHFTPNKAHEMGSEKTWQKRCPANNYCLKYPNHGPQNANYQRFNQSETMDPAPRNCKATTRESTTTLKTWLQEHNKNPYPTKGEKIMLAIVTKMTLTQVSTWFANARRRLKKENKMTWHPKNRSSELQSLSQEKKSLEDDASSVETSNIEYGSSDIDDHQVPKPTLHSEPISSVPSMFPPYGSNPITKPEMLLDSNVYPRSPFDNYGNNCLAKTTSEYQQPAHDNLYLSKYRGSGAGDRSSSLSFDASMGMRDSHCLRAVPTDNSRCNWPTTVNNYHPVNTDNESPATMRHYQNAVSARGYVDNSCPAYQVDYHHHHGSGQFQSYKHFNPTFDTPSEETLLQFPTPRYFHDVSSNSISVQSLEHNHQPNPHHNHQPSVATSSPHRPQVDPNLPPHVQNPNIDTGLSMAGLLQPNAPVSHGAPPSTASLSPSNASSPLFHYNPSSSDAVPVSIESSNASCLSSFAETSYSPLPHTSSPSYNSNFNLEFATNAAVANQGMNDKLLLVS